MTMQQYTAIAPLRAQIAAWRQQGLRIALVATMGNLHRGHLSLVTQAQAVADKVVVSIFVNPLQFAPHEDYAQYPRTWQQDCAQLQTVAVDAVFYPDASVMYPLDAATVVDNSVLSTLLCGVSRPHFFRGVATVVTKLFNIVQPDVTVFGEKDYQQLVLIQQMVADLNFPITVLGAPIVREPDGLAMSSRNQYLDKAQRQAAPALYHILQSTRARVGSASYADLEETAKQQLTQAGFLPDYVAIRRSADLQVPVAGDESLRLLAAVYLGKTRLLDNIAL